MRQLHTLAIAAAAVLAAACTDNANDMPSPDSPDGSTTIHAIHATTTRTDFDGTASSWTEGDAMSVIIAGGDLATQACRFTVVDPTKGTFTNENISLDPAATYDFYAVYPYNADKTGIAPDNARFDIGSATQTQQGSSASHVAPLDPLTGCAKNVTADAASLLMHHTATVIQLRLHNATGAPISGIETVTVTAPEGTILAAPHAIDPADGSVTPDTDKASNAITLTVQSSGQIPADGEFSCWMAATPFTIYGGSNLDIEVTTTDGTVYHIVKPFNTDRNFPAGTVMASQIELSAATEDAKEISLDIDFTVAATYPDGFPTAQNPSSDETRYTFAGHTFRILSPGQYYFYQRNGSGYLAMEGITKNEPADIVLPAIKGYAPTQIHVTTGESSKQKYYYISVTDIDGSRLEGTKEKNTYFITDHFFNPKNTDDHSEYRIHISYTATSNSTKFPLTAISVTYTRL